jgi:hypothetical protein
MADILWGNPELGLRPYEPQAKGVEDHLNLLLQGDLDSEARALVLRTGADGKPDSIRKALQLILQCPEYQLA